MPDQTLGYLVYAVTECGTTYVVAYGPGADSLEEAEAMARRLRGIVVSAPVIADHS